MCSDGFLKYTRTGIIFSLKSKNNVVLQKQLVGFESCNVLFYFWKHHRYGIMGSGIGVFEKVCLQQEKLGKGVGDVYRLWMSRYFNTTQKSKSESTTLKYPTNP